MGFEEVKKFKYKFKRISSINIELIEEFSCGLEELDKKLIQMKENYEGTTFVFLDETNGQIIGYCTYCASGLKKAYENDSICGTWERLADAIYKGGASALSSKGSHAVGTEKSLWAKQICPHMDVDRNKSPSFCAFRDKLRNLCKNK